MPERWLRGNLDEVTKSLGNLTWGHGARMCLGEYNPRGVRVTLDVVSATDWTRGIACGNNG